MSYLFVIESSRAKPNTETLLIEPFKTIWDRDKSKDKGTAIKEFSFIEFMSSKKKTNPYAGYSISMREDKLKDLLFDKKWKPDSLIKKGLEQYEEFQQNASPTYSYYLSVLNAAEKMKSFFNGFDFAERHEKSGLPIYKPKEITSALIDTDKVLQNLNSMKEKVEQELFETTKTRANKQVGYFED